jgi:hypothetical protein
MFPSTRPPSTQSTPPPRPFGDCLTARIDGSRRPDGIFIAPFEQGEIGPDLFRAACGMGLEGLVSKHRERGYRTGTSPNWIKVKNPTHPAMTRVKR